MPLTTGQSLSFYKILGPLGAGGMGEVYRARDTRLEREVAIKVLPEELADDDERLMRFEREAKTLASLNHPNVAGIHNVDKEGDVCFLALELVPGEDLSERLSRGPLPFDEALDVCQQIATGLDAAHEAGVVHRDLKPANVRITTGGVVKILDFGLAKAMHPRTSTSGTSTAQSDSFAMTVDGTILGTPTYMSPEQARGKPIDRRTDIWAFGCVLYECLTGKRAFGGESMTDVLAAIVSEEPDWNGLPTDTPVHLRALLARCLDKDPRTRLRDIGEARVRLAEPQPLFEDHVSEGLRPQPTIARRQAWLPWAIAIAAVGLAGASLLSESEEAAPNRQVRFTIRHPSEGSAIVHSPVVAPDGSYVAYIASEGNVERLWVRELDADEPRALPGTEGASAPFVSPDGRFLGFYAGNKLKKVAVSGGTPVEIGDITNNPGAAWRADGTIVYTPTWTSGLVQTRAEGGAVEELTTLDPESGEIGHFWPTPMPDGQALLYTVYTTAGTLNKARIELLDSPSGPSRFVTDGAQPIPLATGHLLYFRAGVYELAPFDALSGMITGPPRTVFDELAPLDSQGSSQRFVSISTSGVMAYVKRSNDMTFTPRSWFWLDSSGELEAIPLPTQTLGDPALSPDGSLAIVRMVAGDRDIFVHDLEDGTETRITTESVNIFPKWSPNGDRVLYKSLLNGSYDIFEADSTGARAAKPLYTREVDLDLGGLTLDGKALLVTISGGSAGEDIVLVDLESGELETLVATPGNDENPTLSPDGRFMAYTSDVSGTTHVYVVPLSGESGPVKVSRGGGDSPSWATGGAQLAFNDGTQVVLADISFKDELLRAGRPVPFVRDGFSEDLKERYTGDFAINAEGNRMIIGLLDEPTRAEIEVVLDGFAMLGIR
ncbi:MAG: serine/threonine protein kinase/Tol biopolymer transport system component [Chlamydiales bacterium]|jgi:serine/threonine protein kinase/Tol biopolymer transport system component